MQVPEHERVGVWVDEGVAEVGVREREAGVRVEGVAETVGGVRVGVLQVRERDWVNTDALRVAVGVRDVGVSEAVETVRESVALPLLREAVGVPVKLREAGLRVGVESEREALLLALVDKEYVVVWVGVGVRV